MHEFSCTVCWTMLEDTAIKSRYFVATINRERGGGEREDSGTRINPQ